MTALRRGAAAVGKRGKSAKPRRGPVEDVRWPEKLRGCVVDPERLRIHGYAAAADLAVGYSFAEVVLLALTGAPPSTEVGSLFSRALIALMPVSVGDASAHAALLARLTGARAASVVGAAGVVAAQAGDALSLALAAVAQWEERGGPLPPSLRGSTRRDAAVRRSLRAAAREAGLTLPILGKVCTAEAAATAAFRACGLEAPWQLVTVASLAALPCALAEAFAKGGVDLRSYPMTLPPFEYTEQPRRDAP